MPPKLKETKDKSKRRGNNEGSIYQRKQDNRWVGSVTVGYKTDGKPVRKTVYGNSRQEVAKQITALTGEVFANGYTTVSARQERNFKLLFEEWFDTFKAPCIASNTEEKMRGMFRNHFWPAFGDLDVGHIELIRAQRFFNEKSKKGFSMEFIRVMKQTLNQFFKYAVSKHLVNANPISDVIIPDNGNRYLTNEKLALSENLRKKIFSALENEPVLKPVIITFMLTGLRPQELIALKWENIDFKNSIISVKQAVNCKVEFDDNGNVVERTEVLGKTKTQKSVRTFIAPKAVMDALTQWREYSVHIGSEFVFCNTKNGEMRKYYGLRTALQRFLKKNGLENEGITLYTFRHTFATMLLEQRESAKIVADLMGHTQVSTTLNIYSHVVGNSAYEQTAQTLDGMYAKYS